MLKTWNHYFYLMHKNEKVAVMEIDPDTGNILGIGKEKRKELLPVGTQRSDEALKKWWKRRAIPTTRNGVRTILQQLRMDSAESLLIANLGLSLTDHYWMRPTGSDLTWETVNLYENEFSDTIGEFLFTGMDDTLDLHGKTMFLPSASLQGELKKKWLIGEDNCRYLVKGNDAVSCQQSINEVFATRLHQLQAKVPYTEYRLVRIDTKEGESLGCVCKNFSSCQYEFIPAYEISLLGKKKNDCSEYEFFIQNCVENGLQEDEVRGFLEYQILTDFLLTNTDRHFNNFGVLRDSNTLKFVAMAPIFDSGNSMFWNMPSIPKNEKLLDIRVASFKKKEIDLIDYVQDPKGVDINMLPDIETLRLLYSKDTICSAARLQELEEGWKRKIEYVESFQRGKDIKRERFAYYAGEAIADERLKERMEDVMGGEVMELYSERIAREAREEGREEGLERGLERGLEKGKAEMVDKLVRQKGWTEDEACSFAEIETEKYRNYRAKKEQQEQREVLFRKPGLRRR